MDREDKKTRGSSNKYVHVGDLVFVQGEIQNKKVESGERAGQYIYSLHANDIKFIPKGKPDEKGNGKRQPSIAFQDDKTSNLYEDL